MELTTRHSRAGVTTNHDALTARAPSGLVVLSFSKNGDRVVAIVWTNIFLGSGYPTPGKFFEDLRSEDMRIRMRMVRVAEDLLAAAYQRFVPMFGSRVELGQSAVGKAFNRLSFDEDRYGIIERIVAEEIMFTD